MLTTNIIKLPWEKPDAWAFWGFLWILRHPVFNSLTCDLRGTMPCQRSITLFTHMWLTGYHATPEVTHTLFPTQPFLPWVLRIWESVFYLGLLIPREAEDFSRGDRHFKHVPPPTYLICLSPKELYTVGSI